MTSRFVFEYFPVSTFAELSLSPTILKSLQDLGYVTPTPIQKATIPLVNAGRDVLGIAQTGTGKTAAFCLPIIEKLSREKIQSTPGHPRVLILTPTRELAIQIDENIQQYAKNLRITSAVIFGGVSQGRQVTALKKAPHILVATPGRLLDLNNQKLLNLRKVDVFVLDEADRMLDMGFLNDIRKILGLLPSKRHNLFFSATMPKDIQELANSILVNPEKVEVTPQSTTVKMIQQSAMYVEKADKIKLLVHLLQDPALKKVLVFVEMKYLANRVCEALIKAGISAQAIHGNKSQPARQRAISEFASGQVRVLVATDIASRGIDIDGITHVINYELSNILESYVHRIGRTARAGTSGVAISLVSGMEKSYLAAIEKTTGQKIKIEEDHPFHSQDVESARILSVGKAKAALEAQRKGGRTGATSDRRRTFQRKRKPGNSR